MVWDIERGVPATTSCPSPGRPTPASAAGTTTAERLRAQRLQERRHRHPHAGRHRQQERQPAAQRPGARRRHHRREGRESPRRHRRLDGREQGEHLRHAPVESLRRRPGQRRRALSAQGFNEGKGKPFTAEDIRFTAKGDTLYVIALGWPDENLRPSNRWAQRPGCSTSRLPLSNCWAVTRRFVGRRGRIP